MIEAKPQQHQRLPQPQSLKIKETSMRTVTALLLSILCLSGCGRLTREQTVAQAKILENSESREVTFVKWWRPIDAKTADFPSLFGDAATESSKRSRVTFNLLESLVKEKQPTHVLRVQYRKMDEQGRNVLNDALCFVAGDQFAFSLPAASQDSMICLQKWQEHHFR